MNNKIIYFILFLLITFQGFAQKQKTGKNHTQWKTHPFDHQVFIENKGQFDNIIPGGEKILFGAQLGNVWAYFTRHGIEYCYTEFPKTKEAAYRADPDENGPIAPLFHYLTSSWIGSNAFAAVNKADKLGYYYTYPKGLDGTIKTDIYKKITYRNIYPGIDVEYTFIPGKQGFKYSLIVHPGADISKVKLDYSVADGLKINTAGDVVISSEIGEFTEHSPVSYYRGEQEHVDISYKINGKTESFSVAENYDKTKTLVIDPWVTNPLFIPLYDVAYDLDYDYYGNVFAFGSALPYQLEKFNSSGVPLWIYNAPFGYDSYGDVVCGRKSGEAYITQGFGAAAIKISPAGLVLGTFPGTNRLNEFWRAVYNPCFNNIIIGGGGTSGTNQACILDTNMTTITPVNVLGAGAAYHDIVLLAPDPSGLTCYMTTSWNPPFNNILLQVPLPALAPTAYQVHDNFNFEENRVPSYIADGLSSNGYDGMACSPNWLYIYNSITLKRIYKNTGILKDSIQVSNAVLAHGSTDWGGLATDAMDKIYVGCHDSIKRYDSSMVLDSSIVLPNTVYDVVLSSNNILYACGDSFVCQINLPPLPSIISSASGSPTACSACNGSATVTVNYGVSPFLYLWSNGSTNQTDTGLCAGLYTVTVTDGSCPPRIDTAVISVSGKTGYSAPITDTNPDCNFSKGNITAYPTGGTFPYTYYWSNGETNQKDTGLVAGTYTCTVMDGDGCKTFISVTLVNPVTPIITIVPNNDSICSGSNLSLSASGISTYNWTPAIGLSCYTCPSPIATPTATTTYTLTGFDSNGCIGVTTTTIKVYQTPKPVITGKDSVCASYHDTLTVSGGTTYLWSSGSTSSSIIVSSSGTQTITVTAYNGMCSSDTSFTIHVVSPAASIVASKDSTCSGDTVKLVGSGGSNFKWSTLSTSKTIIVSPTVPTTYTLYAGYGICKDSATVTIGIIKPLIISLSAMNDTVCPNEMSTIAVNSSGGPGTYKWSNGATTSSINISDSVTTTYTATVYGKCDTMTLNKTVVVIPLPKPVINGTLTKCKGSKDTLTVSGGTTYKWSNGSTKTTYYTGAINADSTISVIVCNSLNCPDTTHFTISVAPQPSVIVTYTPNCAGIPVIVEATANGTGPFSYSWLPGGKTTDTITVIADSATTYTVVVSNGCKTTKIVTVTPESASLTACCNTTILEGEDTVIIAGGVKSYLWIPSTGLNCDTCATVIATPTVTTTYTVTGTDSLGCTTERIITIVVETPCFNLTIPNVFTPNNPGALGLDNIFFIKTENLSSWSIIIYDRWGKELYKSSNPDVYWNGSTESGGNAPDGVYYYIINATCRGNTYKKDGFVQLIR